MRYLPQTDWCATLQALLPQEGGATLAEAFARLDERAAAEVFETRGVSLAPSFARLSPAKVEVALLALRRYRSHMVTTPS